MITDSDARNACTKLASITVAAVTF